MFHRCHSVNQVKTLCYLYHYYVPNIYVQSFGAYCVFLQWGCLPLILLLQVQAFTLINEDLYTLTLHDNFHDIYDGTHTSVVYADEMR